MRLRCLGLTLAAFLIPVTSALAATVSVQGDHLVFTAAPGERNQLAIFDSTGNSSVPSDVYSVDDRPPAAAGPGCHGDPGQLVTCDRADVTAVTIELGDGDDSGGASVAVPAMVNGGPGVDALSSPGEGAVTGGPGDDLIYLYATGASHAAISGGPGTDKLWLYDAPGPGDAGSSQPGFRIRPDGLANDGLLRDPRANVAADIENMVGSSRADQLFGTAADNEISGGTGPDAIVAGAGDDKVDLIDVYESAHVRDIYAHYADWADHVSCGPGQDRVIADIHDRWSADCERVLVKERRYAEPGPEDEYAVLREEMVLRYVVLNGDRRANRIMGDRSARNRIFGRGGNDRLSGGRRPDSIDAGPGADVIRSAGGNADVVSCGSGRDRVVADKRDRVGRDCERVRRR
jgi:Ca2+-binding RTX toxin-like protein